MKSQLRLPFYLAWQYVRRGKKWTLLLTIFMMTIAFVNLIFISSLFNGIIDGTNKQIINTLTGNIYITPSDGQETIENKDDVLLKIRSIAQVTGVSAQTNVFGQIKYNEFSGSWQILAINPDDEKQVTNISENIIDGKYLDKDDLDQILIGIQIAGGKDVEQNAFSFKGAKVGEKISLNFNGLIKEFTIKGIFKTKFIQSDSRAFITQKAYDKMTNNEFSQSTNTIAVKINDDKKNDQVINEIKNVGINDNIYTWREVAGLMKSVSESFNSINILISIVGILIAAVTIFIVIYVDIVNKRKQIGILRAIGVKPYIIIFSYVILSAVYIVIGVIFGTIVFQFILVPYFQANPFVLPICDAVLVLNKIDYIARVEAVTWVSIISGLIPSAIITRTKMLNAILGR